MLLGYDWCTGVDSLQKTGFGGTYRHGLEGSYWPVGVALFTAVVPACLGHDMLMKQQRVSISESPPRPRQHRYHQHLGSRSTEHGNTRRNTPINIFLRVEQQCCVMHSVAQRIVPAVMCSTVTAAAHNHGCAVKVMLAWKKMTGCYTSDKHLYNYLLIYLVVK